MHSLYYSTHFGHLTLIVQNNPLTQLKTKKPKKRNRITVTPKYKVQLHPQKKHYISDQTTFNLSQDEEALSVELQALTNLIFTPNSPNLSRNRTCATRRMISTVYSTFHSMKDKRSFSFAPKPDTGDMILSFFVGGGREVKGVLLYDPRRKKGRSSPPFSKHQKGVTDSQSLLQYIWYIHIPWESLWGLTCYARLHLTVPVR